MILQLHLLRARQHHGGSKLNENTYHFKQQWLLQQWLLLNNVQVGNPLKASFTEKAHKGISREASTEVSSKASIKFEAYEWNSRGLNLKGALSETLI